MCPEERIRVTNTFPSTPSSRYYQQQLQLDCALSEEERLARWEERLRWELDDVRLPLPHTPPVSH